jgi:DNA polymerase elongation subunit (family B)
MRRKRNACKLPIYTLDIETDPFEYGKMVYPFCIGLWDGETFRQTWGEDCIRKMHEIVMGLDEGTIFMHNGGGFDFFYLKSWFSGETMIRGSRILKTNVKRHDSESPHEMRDSYAIMPFALKRYKKDDIDYNKLKKEVREIHRDEILSYLRNDCVYLHELCSRFLKEFGDKVTVGSAAMAEIKKRHEFEELSKTLDNYIRKDYYYGGRVECFKKGYIEGWFNVYDVNSMYPYVMANYLHPIGSPTGEGTDVVDSTCFLTVEGENHGAFPSFDEETGKLRFDKQFGIFHVTIHEWNVAVSRGLFKPYRIHRTINFEDRGSFGRFVSDLYDGRKQAKVDGDTTLDLLYKYVLNSGYGKFGQNPENYFEQSFCPIGENPNKITIDCPQCTAQICDTHWMIDVTVEEHGVAIWKRKNVQGRYYNVATGASITGAARSVLLDAISRSKSPIYCDTDSLICESISGIDEDGARLGAWKTEASCDAVAITGRKTYALYLGGQLVKKASKGAKIEGRDIVRLAKGEIDEVIYERDAPTFHLDGSYNFVRRRVRCV